MCVCVCLGLHYLCYQADRASPRADRVLGNASQRARGEPVLCSGETNNILVIFERLRYQHNPREFEFYGCKCLRESFVKPLKETLKLIMSRQVSKKGQNVFCVFRHDAIPLIFAIIITFKSRRISLVAKTSNVWCTSELLPFLEKKKRCVNVCKPARPEEKPSQLLWVWTNRISATENIPFLLRRAFFFWPPRQHATNNDLKARPRGKTPLCCWSSGFLWGEKRSSHKRNTPAHSDWLHVAIDWCSRETRAAKRPRQIPLEIFAVI